MKERYTRKDLLNGAGGAGIALAIIPIIYYFVSCRFSLSAAEGTETPFVTNLLMMLFWLFKFAAGIFIMRFFMRTFVNRFDGVSISVARRFGVLAAVFSALTYAACAMAYHKFIDPNMMRTMVDYALSNSPIPLDSNTLSVMDKAYDAMPVGVFVSKFIYCSLYGMILSAILSSRVGADPDIFIDSEK